MNVSYYLSYDIKITLKSHFWHKKFRFYHYVAMLLWATLHSYQNLGLSILMHGIISLLDVMS